MTLFWIYAALLIGVALAFLMTPLLRKRAAAGGPAVRAAANLAVFRDQLVELDADLAAGTISREQWEAARGDLERGLLEDVDTPPASAPAPVKRSKVAAIAVVVAVPLISVSLYLALGNRQGLAPAKDVAQGAPHQLTKEQIETMVASLAQRLESNPDDLEGWAMLARSYNAMGRFADAAAVYAKVESKFSQDAQFLADYADTLAMAQGQSLEGKPEALIQRALKADANNVKALALAGTVQFEKRDYGKATEYWRQILPLLPADSEMGNSVRASIQEAQGKLGQGGVAQPAIAAAGAVNPKTAAATKVSRVSGTVRLAPAVAARAAPEDTVFVLARPAQGSRMPLAATRVKVKDLPLEFSFDDSMAMNPSAKLSDFAAVVVAARVSKSGNVMPQPGDLEGVSKTVRPGSSDIKVEIANEIK